MIQWLRSLSASVQALDIRSVESASVVDLESGFVPELFELLTGASEMLEHARRAFPDLVSIDPAAGDEETAAMSLRIDRAMQGESGRGRIAKVIVLGHIELARQRCALERLRATRDEWTLIDAYSEARRRTLKVLSALEWALCSHQGVIIASWHHSELEIALTLRRKYARLRCVIARALEPDSDNVRRLLREAASTLARLIGSDAYSYIRTSHRRQLRAVEDRLCTWLHSDEPGLLDGVRAWREFVALVDTLMQSSCSDLREHLELVSFDVPRVDPLEEAFS